MVVIIDYNMGNIGSVLNMLARIGAQARVSADHGVIRQADHLILPGVGSFDTGMQHLAERDLIGPLGEKVAGGTPVLGICLGMQLLSRRSEEGERPGLGWIDAETIRFRFDGGPERLRIPHMGWNTVSLARPSPLYRELDRDEDTAFYFVHSYHVVCADEADVLTRTHYGFDFTSSVQRANVMGTQFHPEKSHKYGMRLLKNFVEMG